MHFHRTLAMKKASTDIQKNFLVRFKVKRRLLEHKQNAISPFTSLARAEISLKKVWKCETRLSNFVGFHFIQHGISITVS
jgi:hypothetical protein